AAKLPEGGVDAQSMQELMDVHQPKLVAVTHVPTNSGLVQDVHSIGKLCRERGIWYLVDACQSAGQMPLDVQAIGCDFLSATMRKWLRGPRGAGFLFASDRVLEIGLEPFCPDMAGANWVGANRYQILENARRFEYWEKPYALLLGSKVAVEYVLELGLEGIEKRVTALADLARQQLSALPGVRILDRGERQCGIVTVAVENCDGAELKQALLAANVNVSISMREFAVIDFDEKGVKWALRMSPHYFNTPDEIGQAVAALGDLLRSKS
ncbi:MAG: aminotransferase class V-fold PLP-dependent enzyme, partial [Bacteroidota bacterium]